MDFRNRALAFNLRHSRASNLLRCREQLKRVGEMVGKIREHRKTRMDTQDHCVLTIEDREKVRLM